MRFSMIIRLATICALGVASSLMMGAAAQADLRVSFDEGAPKDRFRIVNTGGCAFVGSSILLDLSTSRGGLIFDVTGVGEGVEVFQPFDLVEGAAALASVPTVLDGETRIRLDVVDLQPLAAIAFTIDVDDTLGQRAITVSGSEIEGASVSYTGPEHESSAAFSTRATAVLEVAGC
jgi:hypothetical protein